MGAGENRLLRRHRLCEADPSPGLWPPPFSKGELVYRYSQQGRLSLPMQALGEGLRQSRRMDRWNWDESPASQAPPLRGGSIPRPLAVPLL